MTKLVLLLKAPPPPEPGLPLALVTTSPLPQTVVDVFYSVTFQAAGGEPPYLWSKPSGAFPDGMALSGNVLSGTPSVSGFFDFPIRLVDSDTPTPGQIDLTYELTIAAAPTQLTVLPASIPNGKVGQFTSTQMQAAGAAGSVSWGLNSGALPPGMTFSITGVYSGTPTTVGTYVFVFHANDGVSPQALSGQFTVTITQDTLQIATSVLPFAPLNTSYSAQLISAHAVAPEAWRFISGQPAWLTLNAATGDLGGMSPGTPADYAITFGLLDAGPAPEVTKTIGLRVLTEGPQDYFIEQSADSTILRAYDLRSQAQLDSRMKVSPSLFWTYDFAGDPHLLKQDAAKLVKPPRRLMTTDPYTAMGAYFVSKGLSATIGSEGIHTDKQIIVPIGINSGSILVTYDIWFGQEYFDNNGTVNSEKAMFLTLAGASAPTGDPKNFGIIHMRLRPQQINGSLNEVGRLHDDSDNPGGVPFFAGLDSRDPYSPTVNTAYPSGAFRIHANKWTRFWDLIEFSVPVEDFTEWNAFTGATLAPIATTTTQGGLPIGTNIPFDRRTRWMADEDRDPVRVFGPVPFPHHPAYPYIGRYVFRWDTSTENWTEFSEIQVLDLNNIGSGDSFTLTVPAIASSGLQNPNSTFPAETTASIGESADMSAAIDTAMEVLNVIYHVAVVKGAGQTYAITYTGLGTHTTARINMPLVVVNPTGFTPSAVTVVQQGGKQADLAKGQTGLLIGYHRNITVHHNRTDIVLSNTALFRRPIGN